MTSDNATTARPPRPITDDEFRRLRTTNIAAGVLHLVSALLMLSLNNGFRIGISGFWLDGPPGSPVADGVVTQAFTYPLAVAVAAFLLLSAFFHFLIAFGASGRYRSELEHQRNRFRWIEYSMSATLMIVVIATIVGITDFTALIAIAGANAAMILFGWVMEVVNEPGPTAWWGPFWFGCIAGATPWIAIVASIVYGVNSVDGAQAPPTFVYVIIVSLFLLFNCFAVNQWLQYRKIGKWSDYVFGERTYIVLSFVAKSALAWQVFANVLVD
ncbi:MAG: heliorhodopsin HeR [Ilumatobacteraceae bacterium]